MKWIKWQIAPISKTIIMWTKRVEDVVVSPLSLNIQVQWQHIFECSFEPTQKRNRLQKAIKFITYTSSSKKKNSMIVLCLCRLWNVSYRVFWTLRCLFSIFFCLQLLSFDAHYPLLGIYRSLSILQTNF